MEEKYVMRVIATLNNAKHTINPYYDNPEYQRWLQRNELDKHMKFRDWIIEGAKKEVLKIIDTDKNELLAKVLAVIRRHPYNSNYSVDGRLVSVDKVLHDEIRGLFQ